MNCDFSLGTEACTVHLLEVNWASSKLTVLDSWNHSLAKKTRMSFGMFGAAPTASSVGLPNEAFSLLKKCFFYNRVCYEKKEVRLLFHCFYHFCCTRTSLASQFSTFSSRGLSNARPLVSASSERPLLPAAATAAHLFYHASSMLPCSSTNIFGYVWFQTLARNNTLEIFLYKNNALSRDGFHVVSNVLLRPLKATRSPFIVSNPDDVFWQEQIFKFLQVFLTVNTSFATVFLQNKFNLW